MATLGMVGLGRMGGNMAERLRRGGHAVVGYDRAAGTRDVESLEALVQALPTPRIVWVMVPAGTPTYETIDTLKGLLSKGDVVVDGGNSRYTDDQRHAIDLADAEIGFVDAGVSGGVWGLTEGYALMVGGESEHVALVQPFFDVLKPEGDSGYVHAGAVGAGHFAKMVHNGIEYGLMAAYAEGYELLQKKDIVKDVPGSFKAWSRGTVVRSWLLDLAVTALADNPTLDGVSDYTVDSGEGKWTVEEAIVNDVPMPVISASLFARFASRQQISPTMQMVAALRGQFGGHPVMTIAEGEELRSQVGAGDADPSLGIKTERKHAGTAKKGAVRGRKADEAGPSSGTGTTTAHLEGQASRRTGARGGRKAASAGPTSGSGTAT